MNKNTQKKGLDVSAKSFVTAIVVIFLLMALTYLLTFLIPGGEYLRIPDANGNVVIDTSVPFSTVQGGIPFWKWILSPILVLGAEGNGSLIAVILFLLVIGGVFNSLDKCGLMKYMLDVITNRFAKNRYRLLFVITFFFMALGAFIGSYEECIPLVPIVVALSVTMGWDALTGLGMSLLAAGCGFAAGVSNPFTIGVAQEVAGLPMFSGMWFRCLVFILIYVLLADFLYHHVKRIEKPLDEKALGTAFEKKPSMDRALISFVGIMGVGILVVLSSVFIPELQDYTMIVVALMFLSAGIVASLLTGLGLKGLGSTFVNGLTSILPAVLMILMANSIKYTLAEAHILDTILHSAVLAAGSLPRWVVILFIYFIVLIMNFFIASGSAKAFLLIPLIMPLAQLFEIPAQLCVVAFAFGDGFSNVFYPTNPVLLIGLGLADVSYVKWVRWSVKFQLANLILTSIVLLFGLWIGYC